MVEELWLVAEECVKWRGSADGGHGVGLFGEWGELELNDAVGEKVGVVVNDVEAGDVGTCLGIGDDVIPASALLGVVGKACGLIVLDGAVLG